MNGLVDYIVHWAVLFVIYMMVFMGIAYLADASFQFKYFIISFLVLMLVTRIFGGKGFKPFN